MTRLTGGLRLKPKIKLSTSTCSNLHQVGTPDLILLRGGYFTDFSNKSHWIALNPAFAAYMNLSPCNDGFFAWQNEDGMKVVESIYWQSGNINGSARDNYEASEGWIVVMQKGLFEALCKNEQVFSHKMVLRRYSKDLLDTSHKAYVVKEVNSLRARANM